ncbi:malate-2H(+)/Na(+)-lactate antiporter [bacterium BMS3Abin05]|nr:malate-2H(+)/Na(+)-lactate antiporter [bacterium BMS3Abin05]
MSKNMKWIAAFLVLSGFILLREQTSLIHFNETGKDFGWWSLLPALITIVLCFLTREVISSLFLGIVLGGIISGHYNIIQYFLIPSIGSPKYGEILLVYLWSLGGLIGIWTRTGGAQYFAELAGRKIVRGPKSAKFFAFLLGILFHQGGTVSTILAGSTAKPITDAQGVSHEEVSYIIDSTASPVATLLPFNVWPIYIGGLVVGTSPLFANLDVSKTYLFKAIPFNFYAIFAILFTLLFSFEKLPWYGKKMKAAMDRVKATGKLDRDGAKPLMARELTTLQIPPDYRPSAWDFLLPIGVLLSVSIGPYILYGKLHVSEAFVLAVLTSIFLALFKGMRLKTIMEGFVDGCKGVTIGAIILGLAVTLGAVSKEIGTANFLIRTTSSLINPIFMPAIFLFVTMVIAFSTGTSWGTYAVVFPIAMPLAYAVNPDPFYNLLCFSAVTGGSVYGDQCSPISDTTILSSLATGTDLMDHVTTQLPLATVAAGIGAVLYTVLAIFVV